MKEFDRNLRRHIRETSNNFTAVHQVVGNLRATYPEYARKKLAPFTKKVRGIVESMNTAITPSSSATTTSTTAVATRNILKRKVDDRQSTSDDDEDESSLHPLSSPNRTGKIDRIEQPNTRRRAHLPLVSSKEDSEDGAVLMSEDEVFRPEFDLTKSMLRNSYSRSNFNEKPKNVGNTYSRSIINESSKNVELEVVNNNNNKKEIMEVVDLIREDRRIVNPVAESKTQKPNRLLSDSDVGGGEVKGKNGGTRFKDLGGMDLLLHNLKIDVIIPFMCPELPRAFGRKPVTGILLYGPPGCGKTSLAHAIANETEVPFYEISSAELVSGISGASEENIRELFSKAERTAPSIVFIDEIDAIALKRENHQKGLERRILTQLMTCMDDLRRKLESSDGKPGHILVIGATNRPDDLDPAIRRPGRFGKEIALDVPNEYARVQILSVLTEESKLEDGVDLVKIARSTPGFVGADLEEVVDTAFLLAMRRNIYEKYFDVSKESTNRERNEDLSWNSWSTADIEKFHSRMAVFERSSLDEDWWKTGWSPEELGKCSIAMADLEVAVKVVQPSLKREGFSSIPDVKWEDVGGLDMLREEFDSCIIRRIKYPEEYEGKRRKSGILLYGPPGCGKTLIAKAVASEAGANFIYVAGPELLSKYVGESELAVRKLFSRARMCSPCIIFFDEVDGLTAARGKEGSQVNDRVLGQLLVELGGVAERKDVYVIGATNRPDMIDRALLRPGRFDKILYVPLPNEDERGLILKALAKEIKLDDEVDLVAIGRSQTCANLSGADLSAVLDEAETAAQKEKSGTVKAIHFDHAFRKIHRSVSDKQIKYYNRLSKTFRAA